MAGNLTRRDLLKAGALITAVAGCTDEQLMGQPAPAGQPEPVARDLTADVVVVGAGYAGLGAAWELFKNGQRVIVLEANARVGGRVWSSQLSDVGPCSRSAASGWLPLRRSPTSASSCRNWGGDQRLRAVRAGQQCLRERHRHSLPIQPERSGSLESSAPAQ